MCALVSVVVTNWNGRHFLEACLAALASQSYPEIEVIVVDNGSTDGSPGWVKQNFPLVRLIENSENRGFAAANNQGICAARGEFVALLNNDAFPEPGWLAALVQAMGQSDHIGMAASRMVFADRPDLINSAGICIDRCGIVWDCNSGRPDDAAAGPPSEAFGASAGAGLYRRALFDDIGLLDDDFFIYLEDVDLAWRAQWRGWHAVYVPAARVLHAHSATMHEGSARKTYLLARNKVWLLLKNYPWPHWLLYLPLILFYEALSWAYQASRGQGAAALRGRWAGLRALPVVLRRRRALWARPHAPARDVFARLQPAAWPWRVAGRYRHVAGRADRSAPAQ
jgi:GT2 family glycosyltransferase